MKVALIAAATLSWTMASAFAPEYAPKPRLLSTALGGATNTNNNERRSKASQQLEGTIIVGGGIAGLATAAALRSVAGVHSVRVVERLGEESFRDERAGAGAQLGPNGLRALRAIGGEELLDFIVSSGSKLVGNSVVLPDLPEPMVIPDTAEADTGLPQVLIRWGVLRSALADLIPEDSITFNMGQNIMGYSTNGEDGTVQLVSDSGDEIEIGSIAATTSSSPGAPLIIGADGIHSTFRNCLATNSSRISNFDERREGIKYNKRVNIKAVVKMTLDETEYKPNHTISFFTPEGGTACFAGPAGEGYTYWAISCADNTSDNTNEGDEDVVDDVIRHGLNPEQDKSAMKAALLERLASLNQPLCNFAVNLIKETDPKFIYIQPSEEAEQIGPHLVSSDGKVVCVGDSAHGMSPSYGQSMNFAMEDAVTLALCVRDANNDADDSLASALEAYERARLGRCNEMMQRSAERAAKAMKGEQAEDVSKWIFQWKP